MEDRIDTNLSSRNWLGPDGPLARRLAGYEHRPQQIEMADAVEKALTSPRHLIVEAGTGLGKTLAYLIPAVLLVGQSKNRVLVSTYTITLQQQIVEKDLPLLRAILPCEFTAVLVKGRSNYLCLRRLARAMQRVNTLFAEPDVPDVLDRLRRWVRNRPESSLSDLDFSVPGRIWQQVCSEQGNCLGRRCVFHHRCPYWLARRRMHHANILIINHALLFSELAARQQGSSLFGKYDHAIIDEAQNIENVASEHFGIHVSETRVLMLLGNLYHTRHQKGLLASLDARDAIQAVETATRATRALFRHLREVYAGLSANGADRTPPPHAVENGLSPALFNLAEQLKHVRGKADEEEDRFEINSYRDRLLALADDVEEFVNQPRADRTYWLETANVPDPDSPRAVHLRASPTLVGEYLRDTLFHRVKSVILTSATLSVGGPAGFEYAAKRWGLEDYDHLQLPSPFDYFDQVKLYIETSLPEPADGDEFLNPACEAIQKYLRETRGHAFVLFTSIQMMRRTAEKMAPFFSEKRWPLLISDPGDAHQAAGRRYKLIEQFRTTPNAVLFGVDSFWQGVDVVGEALCNVIIVRLPFAVPDRPLVKARINLINEQGGNAFTEYQLPEAILKFKQGFGRLIRSKTDRGIVVVLDKRIVTKPYGRRFLEALPPVKTILVK